jgi:hypothetical protein
MRKGLKNILHAMRMPRETVKYSLGSMKVQSRFGWEPRTST